MRRPSFVLALLLLTSPAGHGETLHRYDLRLDEALQVLSVQLCFDGPAAPRLVADDDAYRVLLDLRLADGRRPRAGRRGVPLEDVPADSCLDYRVDLAAASERDALHRYLENSRDRLTRPGAWLWRPARLRPDEDLELRFELPQKMTVSAPWQLRERSATAAVFRVGHSPANWPGLVAFGEFEVEEIAVPGARLRVAVLNGSPAPDRAGLYQWVGEAAAAVATLYGRFPIDSPQILIVPYGQQRGGPVPWGQVQRGGGAAVHLLVNQQESLQSFRQDWTAAHELSHLLLPYVGSRNAWLSEGIASYYQNVLRARAGMLGEREAWQKLYDGFERGRRDRRARGMTLRQASAGMHSHGAYMRVYWSGAAFALLADVRLRRATGGRESMDTVLHGLQRCCLPADGLWSAGRLIDELDRISQTAIFSELHAELIDSRHFPDLQPVFAELGLAVTGRRVELSAEAPLADVRTTIMQARTGEVVALE